MLPLRQYFNLQCLVGTMLLCAGCQNQPAQLANPFHSADRVPPPATRSLAPGTGQPYYPGDPLPALPAGSQVPLGQSSEFPVAPPQPLKWTAAAARATALTMPEATEARAPTDAPISGSAPPTLPTQEVLPVAWSDAPPQSPPPRVRLPHTATIANYDGLYPSQYPGNDQSVASSDGFRPRGSRRAPY